VALRVVGTDAVRRWVRGYIQSVTVASDPGARDVANAGAGSSTQSDVLVPRRPRRNVRRLAARGVLAVAVLLSAMGISIVIACFIDDRTIEEARGESVAQVVDTSLTRTVVRFTSEGGRVYIPPNGVLYPSGLQQGQFVRVEYDARNPDRVRVADRNLVLSLLPVSSALVVVWAVLLPVYWVLRRPSVH
jgi:hypothetical protein